MTITRILTATCAAVLAASGHAQLTDLQPGPNFPNTVPSFGNDHTEAIATGDIDNDGDLDVIIANGGSTGNQRNLIFVNQGGAQGGVEGDFIDESEFRLLGEPVDRSRDIAFVDIDSDGDLDACIANSSPSAFFGEISRFYINQGGLQGGNIGFFVDDTLARWGNLVSVPVEQQLFANNTGPYSDWTCDCDFADLDDDGDLDLFNAGYGPNIMGTEPSRIFLNDGTGVFNELWPWADDNADIELHTLDVDAFDLDGDFDLDLFAASRDSQARVFVNNLRNPVGPRPFHDVTQSALIDTGAVIGGDNNYEVEWMDMDSDGDFDAWMLNYNGLKEITLRNDSVPGQVAFNEVFWVRGQSATQETESDFLDFDGDGDLDVVQSNFLGANPLFQSGLAQGLDADRDGLFHRTGTTDDGSLAPWTEVIESGSGGTSWDVHVGDLDGDGDHDVIVGNHAGEPNRTVMNELGIPDTHAPVVMRTTNVQGSQPAGTRHFIHAQISDNGPWYDVDRSKVVLLYRVVGEALVRIPMFGQGGQLFRGEIPSSVDGVVLYSIEAEDRDGNLATTAPVGFMQTSASAFTHGGLALEGAAGEPLLGGSGTLVADSLNTVVFANIAPSAPMLLFASTSLTPVAFKGGTLAALPSVLQISFTAGADGTLELPFLSPPGLSGATLHLQAGVLDGAAVQGVALTNVLTLSVP